MASLSTFSATQEHLATAEETPAVVETTTTIADNSTDAAEQVTTATETEVLPVVQENESDFVIEGDESVSILPAEEAANTQAFNLDEEIRKANPKELAKKLGFSDFLIDMNEYQQKGGKVEDFFNAKGIDYNKVSDEDLIKDDLQKQYPEFTPEKINKLFNAKYGVTDLDTEDSKEQKELQLEADGYLKRQQKIQQQQQFKIPETPILHTDEAYEQWKQEQSSRPKLIEEARNYFLQHEATKNLHESKRVTVSVGEGVAPFNFKIEKPELITQTLVDDGSTWQRLTSTKTGEPDVPKRQLLALIANNPQKFVQDIYNYGQQMGERKKVTEGQNAQRVTTPVHNMTEGKPVYKTGTYGSGNR